MSLHEKIELPKEKLDQCINYAGGSTTRLIKYLRLYQAQEYIDKTLEVIRSSEYEAGRCYRKGQIVYNRKDGQPITQDDLDALKLMDYGQVNIITGNVGDPSVTHRYECDSSD